VSQAASRQRYTRRGIPRNEGWNKRPAIAISARSTEEEACSMIRKLRSGEYRLYSRKVDPKTGRRRNLGTFKSRAAAEKHEREVQYFKRH
jgi:cell division septation protein DedD